MKSKSYCWKPSLIFSISSICSRDIALQVAIPCVPPRNQNFWRKNLFTDYCEFWKIRTIINLTRDICKTKRAHDLKIWTWLHHIQAKPIESIDAVNVLDAWRTITMITVPSLNDKKKCVELAGATVAIFLNK